MKFMYFYRRRQSWIENFLSNFSNRSWSSLSSIVVVVVNVVLCRTFANSAYSYKSHTSCLDYTIFELHTAIGRPFFKMHCIVVYRANTLYIFAEFLHTRLSHIFTVNTKTIFDVLRFWTPRWRAKWEKSAAQIMVEMKKRMKKMKNLKKHDEKRRRLRTISKRTCYTLVFSYYSVQSSWQSDGRAERGRRGVGGYHWLEQNATSSFVPSRLFASATFSAYANGADNALRIVPAHS